MPFRISGLPRAAFADLFALDDEARAGHHARRFVVRKGDDFPCRVSLTVAQPGEWMLLTHYQHQPTESPYRASGPVFVREAATEADLAPGAVPDGFRSSLLSVRAYDGGGMIVAADVTPGDVLEELPATYFGRIDTAYVHLHYARRGCFAARADRG